MRTQAKSTQFANQNINEGLDYFLLLAVASIAALGLVMITSASLDYAGHFYGQPLFYFYRHIFYICIALTAAIVVFQFPISFWEKFSVFLLIAGFLSLMMVLIPGIGKEVKGASRWVALGSLTIQTSEFAKFGLVMYLAGYLVRQQEKVRSHIAGFINPMCVVILMIVLLILQPDFGSVVVLLSAALGMLFLGGVRLTQFVLLIVMSFVAIYFMVVDVEYRMDRLIAYLNPWEHESGKSYQLVQSLIALGRGEWFGLGLGNSVQKLFFLPEAHTDFVFAILAEELGFVGCIAVLSVYTFMIYKFIQIARNAETAGMLFGAYVIYGATIILALQMFINVGVNIGLLPTKGLTLPLISYGGSSLLVTSMFIAIIFRVDVESKALLKRKQTRKGNTIKKEVKKKEKLPRSRGKVYA